MTLRQFANAALFILMLMCIFVLLFSVWYGDLEALGEDFQSNWMALGVACLLTRHLALNPDKKP